MNKTLSFTCIVFFCGLITHVIAQDQTTCTLNDLKDHDSPINQVAVDDFYFGDKILNCSNQVIVENNQIGYLKNELTVVRSHLIELSEYNILASHAGYHLIQGQFECSSEHCDHTNSMALNDFQSLTLVDSKNPNLSGANSLIAQVVAQIDSKKWLADDVSLTQWSRQSGSTGNNNAKDWIVTKMTELNLQVTTESFIVSGNMTRNIIGFQQGTITPDDWYILGAHMDSIPSSGSAPGAVDNASGCAGVLEIARIASGYTFDSSLFFICYSGEEQGLKGSINHTNRIISNGDQSKVKAALIMDMVGYRHSTNTNYEILIESSASNQWLIDVLANNAAIYAQDLVVNTSTSPFGSDHVPYINNDMHGILSIDADWYRYPGYHQNNDLPENINLTQGEYILKTNMASLSQLAGINTSIEQIFANGFE